MNTRTIALAACTLGIALMGGCGSTPNTGTAEDRALLRTQSTDELQDFENSDPSLRDMANRAYAYAIFPRVVNAAVGVGGGHGRGEVYRNGRLIGYADLSQGNIRAQLGGGEFAELILFENQASLESFQRGDFEFDARAQAVAASKGAAGAANYRNGVLVFALPQSGLMVQAAIGGQKFRYIDARDVPQNQNWDRDQDRDRNMD